MENVKVQSRMLLNIVFWWLTWAFHYSDSIKHESNFLKLEQQKQIYPTFTSRTVTEQLPALPEPIF
jgi:hypothetical protein